MLRRLKSNHDQVASGWIFSWTFVDVSWLYSLVSSHGAQSSSPHPAPTIAPPVLLDGSLRRLAIGRRKIWTHTPRDAGLCCAIIALSRCSLHRNKYWSAQLVADISCISIMTPPPKYLPIMILKCLLILELVDIQIFNSNVSRDQQISPESPQPTPPP